MNNGWVAIPHAAIAAATKAAGRLGRAAVVDLYEDAHRMDYAVMLVTDRTLSEQWGLSRGDVWKVLEALAASGLITLEKAEQRSRKPSRVTVHPAVSAGPNQTGSQTGSQNSKPPKPSIGKSQPDREPDREPPRADRIARALRPDQTRSPVVAGERAQAREAIQEEIVRQLLQQQHQDEPLLEPDPRDGQALHAALAQGHTLEELRALWDWSGVSDDPLVAGCRGRHRWRRYHSLLLAPKGALRLARALEWHRAGRPAPAATSPPHRARRPQWSPRLPQAPPEPPDPDWPPPVWAQLDPVTQNELASRAGIVGCSAHPEPDIETWQGCKACSKAYGAHLDHLAQQHLDQQAQQEATA